MTTPNSFDRSDSSGDFSNGGNSSSAGGHSTPDSAFQDYHNTRSSQPGYQQPGYQQPGYQNYGTGPQPGMPAYGMPTRPPRNAIVAALLAFFVGSLGIHNFYLGYTGRGVAQLCITVLTLGLGAIISGIWAFIEFIMILVNRDYRDGEGQLLAR